MCMIKRQIEEDKMKLIFAGILALLVLIANEAIYYIKDVSESNVWDEDLE